MNESQRKYRQSEKGKAQIQRANAKYWERHAAELTAKQVAYRNSERGRVIGLNADYKRRAITRVAGSYTLEEWNTLLSDYEYTCLACGCDSCQLTADHVLPLSKGGDNTILNIQPLCRSCNSSKGVKHIDYR